MKFSKEFFMQRSFEVVWAVFRVGEFVKRTDLRELLEKRALSYLSDKTVDNLVGLEEAVRLAVQIGEIKDVNGRVLLRETENLRQAIAERSRSEGTQRELGESIEGIFGTQLADQGLASPDRGQTLRAEQTEVRPRNLISGKELPESGNGKNGEIQLADAMSTLASEEKLYAYEFEGKHFDTGDVLGFLKANLHDGLKRFSKEEIWNF